MKKKWGKHINVKQLENNRERYSDEWGETSLKLYKNGYYNWMCKAINEKKNILEIGTGVGYSTLSILKNGHFVVAIEENSICLKKTQQLLESEGYRVVYIQREQIKGLSNGYEISYNGIDGEYSNYQAILIEGDILNDTKLVEWISKNYCFDASVCWLIGTHMYRGGNLYIQNSDIRSESRYREMVQKQLSKISLSSLQKDGIINVVDRIPKQSVKMFDTGGRLYYKDIFGIEYKMTNHNFISYEDAFQQGGIRIVVAEVDGKLNVSNKGEVTNGEKYSELCLVSVNFNKEN